MARFSATCPTAGFGMPSGLFRRLAPPAVAPRPGETWGRHLRRRGGICGPGDRPDPWHPAHRPWQVSPQRALRRASASIGDIPAPGPIRRSPTLRRNVGGGLQSRRRHLRGPVTGSTRGTQPTAHGTFLHNVPYGGLRHAIGDVPASGPTRRCPTSRRNVGSTPQTPGRHLRARRQGQPAAPSPPPMARFSATCPTAGFGIHRGCSGVWPHPQ